MTELTEKIDRLTLLVENLIQTVNELKQQVSHLDEVKTSCNNMDRHIQFIEQTYDNLCNSKPMMIASKMTNFFKGNKSIEN